MQSIINWFSPLDWAMLGSWNPTAGQSTTFETVNGRNYENAEILICAPFAHNRFQPATFAPRYSVSSYNQKLRCSWMYNSEYIYVDIEKVDTTHFKLTASSNLPGDCQILMFALCYYGKM